MNRTKTVLLVVAAGLCLSEIAFAQGGSTDMKDMPMGSKKLPMDMKDMPMDGMKSTAKLPAPQGTLYHGVGTVKQINAKRGTVTLEHRAMPSLQWPAMTMEFDVEDGKLLDNVEPGTSVHFALKEKTKGKYVVTGIQK